jgi:hypothetical protein
LFFRKILHFSQDSIKGLPRLKHRDSEILSELHKLSLWISFKFLHDLRLIDYFNLTLFLRSQFQPQLNSALTATTLITVYIGDALTNQSILQNLKKYNRMRHFYSIFMFFMVKKPILCKIRQLLTYYIPGPAKTNKCRK